MNFELITYELFLLFDCKYRLQNQQRVKRRRKRMQQKREPNSIISNDFETDIETFSTAETDIGDDEFYDCSDLDDDDSLKG